MDEKERVQDYLELVEDMRTERQPWQDIAEEVSEYVIPTRDMWNEEGTDSKGSFTKASHVYDGTAIRARKTMKNGLVGYNCGPAVNWFKLRAGNEDTHRIPYAKDWLEECERRIYTMFETSNFYPGIGEFHDDLVSLALAAMIVEPNAVNGLINYTTRHPKEVYILENEFGQVDTVVREVFYKGRTALLRYGDVLEDKLRKEMEKGRNKRFAFVHIIHPRRERDVFSKLAINKPVASVEIYKDSERILRESGYDEMPVVVGRWDKNSGEVYPHSPAMEALVDIKRANEVRKTMMMAAHQAVKPPMQGPAEMLRRMNLAPEGSNPRFDPQHGLEPVALGHGYPFARDVLDGLHEEIEGHFYVSLFQLLQRAEKPMTAREVIERQGEKVAELAHPLTRLNHEVLRPIIRRTFALMARAQLLPPPPPALLAAGVPLTVEFTGILAQAQKRYHNANSINATLAVLGGIAEMTQSGEVFDNFNFDDLARRLAESEGFPQSSIEEEPVVAQKRKARAAIIEEQRQLANAQAAADMAPKLSSRPEPGSPAEQITNQLARAVPGRQ